MQGAKGIYAKMIQQGWFVRVFDSVRGEDGVFYFVEHAVFGKYVHTWGDGNSTLAPITAGALSEGEPVKKLEPVNRGLIHQCFFGVDKADALVYVRVPAAEYRGGIDQVPKESSTNRLVGEVSGKVSPFDNPSVETEFFTRTNSIVPFPELDCVNDSRFSRTPRIRFFVNRLLLGPVTPEAEQRLRQKVIPFTPIRLDPLPTTGGTPPGGGG